jgi:hypothetical protein
MRTELTFVSHHIRIAAQFISECPSTYGAEFEKQRREYKKKNSDIFCLSLPSKKIDSQINPPHQLHPQT